MSKIQIHKIIAGPTALIFGGAALVLLMLGICVTRHRSRRRQETEKSASVLSEILRRHLGESEISDESMKLLSQRLDRFITLCHAVTNSEDSLVKRSEQISAASQTAAHTHPPDG